MITTQPFATTSGDYLSVLISLWLPRYGWTIATPLILCAAIGALYDVRFLFITLMLLFIVIPMLMSFLYTYYMLTPEARRAVIRKKVMIDENHSLRLVYLPTEKSNDGRTAGDRMLLPIADTSTRQRHEVTEPPLPAPEMIPWSDITGEKSTTRFKVYMLKGPRIAFLLIPWSAMKPDRQKKCS